LWQNCTQTRLNPSRSLPYPQCRAADNDRYNVAAIDHLKSNALYVQATEHCIKKSLITCPEIKNFIKDLRVEARFLIAQAIIKTFSHFEAALMSTHEIIHNNSSTCPLSSSKGIIATIGELMSNFSMKSFAHFDTAFNQKTDIIFHALLKSQDLFNQLWEEIEAARSQFYYQAYVTINAAMRELKFPHTSFLCAFHEQGLIPEHEQSTQSSLMLIP